jgi:hypothetical protein
VIHRLALASVASCVVLGCVSATPSRSDKIEYFDMAPRMAYQGFSFDRPAGTHWYLLESEQSQASATLRRETFSVTGTHTFYASVELGSIEQQPESHERFAELARVEQQQTSYGVETVSYAQDLALWQGQWCIRFESSHLVTGAPASPERPLTMILRGYRCLHPAWPKVTLDFFYSERGLPDQIEPKLSEEGEAFLESVRIDVTPDTPA